MSQSRVIDLGVMEYAAAYERQARTVDEVIAAREGGGTQGVIFLVEHPPVVTITPKPGVAEHLLASPELLSAQGVAVAETNRGGDITYHGPGQLVVYPILDLNFLGLGLHEYMRMLEQAVIDTLAEFGIEGRRDPAATGVWTDTPAGLAKICAMGVRVRKWVSMHGLALNVDPQMRHFDLIVPCGLAGRPVTSLRNVLGNACPSMERVKGVLSRTLAAHVSEAARAARAARE